METRICKICGEEKPVEEFSKGRYGYSNCCRKCVSERQSAGHKAHYAQKRIARLDDFTPREIFEHLKKLGYKWEKMTYTKVETVDWNKI